MTEIILLATHTWYSCSTAVQDTWVATAYLSTLAVGALELALMGYYSMRGRFADGAAPLGFCEENCAEKSLQ